MTTKKKVVKAPAKASPKKTVKTKTAATPKVAAKPAKTTKPTVAKKAAKETKKTAVAKTKKIVVKSALKPEKPKTKLPLKKTTKPVKKPAVVKPAPAAQAIAQQPEPKKLRKSEATKLREELIAEQSRLVKEINNLDNIARTNYDDEMATENRAYSIHMAENASENEAINMALGLRGILLTRLQGISEALERLDKGKYGICVRCNCAIDVERLLAKPQAVCCVACRREYEKERRGVM